MSAALFGYKFTPCWISVDVREEWPSAPALCRRAPTVRFIAFEILATGIFSFEYFFSSATLAFVHATRFVFRFVFLAI